MLATAILAQTTSPIGGTAETRVWLAIISLGIVILVQTFGVIKYILTLKVDPLEEKVDELGRDVRRLQEDLLRQVVQIAEDNASHRLEQQRQHNELRLLLSESYVKKEDLNQRVNELTAKIDEIKAQQGGTAG